MIKTKITNIEIDFITLDTLSERLVVAYKLYSGDMADSVSGQMTFKQAEIDMTKPIVTECLKLLKTYFA